MSFARSELIVLNEAQMECLRAPLRSELLSILMAEGPTSVASLGRSTGHPVKSLYYPLRKLMAVGLVRSAGVLSEGRRPEQLFDAAADNVELQDGMREQANKALVGTMSVALREVVRATATSIDVVCHRNVVRLSPSDREELLRMLGAVSDFVRERADPAEPAFSLTMALVPRVAGTRVVG